MRSARWLGGLTAAAAISALTMSAMFSATTTAAASAGASHLTHIGGVHRPHPTPDGPPWGP